MCFDLDSRPPIVPIAGGALDSGRLVLTAFDGNRLAAFEARAHEPAATILILPDVRGLHPYYEELALRFAERGVDALAIDYFGRTAGAEPRDSAFEYMPHVGQTTWAGLQADIRAGIDRLRTQGAAERACFSVGFCFGGRLSWLAATMGLDLAGVIGFYGRPLGTHASGMPAPAEAAREIRGRVLAMFGGDDPGIPAADVAAFDAALTEAGVAHRVISYPGAPHSFFDRQAADFAEDSARAWSETLAFIGAATGSPA